MKIAGIIAEYNPFHNGHMHHIRQTREMTGCDGVVVCMSGHFTQRGEAACLDKWTRARMALECGADVVLELPALWSMRTADAFAAGGVHILKNAGCDVLSFGCETSDVALLEQLSLLRENENAAFSENLRANLASGMPHVRAYAAAAEACLGLEEGTLNRPNLILGVEYLRAIRGEGGMEVCMVPRIGSYHDAAIGEIASASAIRAAVVEGRDAAPAVPECVREKLVQAAARHDADDLLLWKLRSMTPEMLAEIQDVSEGLENRILKLAMQASGRAALLDALKCRRYTQARLSRILTAAMLDMTKTFAASHPLPEYARIIGMRRDASAIVRELKCRSGLPIASDPVALKDNPVFNFECRATDLWALTRNLPEERRAGREFTEKFVLV